MPFFPPCKIFLEKKKNRRGKNKKLYQFMFQKDTVLEEKKKKKKRLGKEKIQQHLQTKYQQGSLSNASSTFERKLQGPNLTASGWMLLRRAWCISPCFTSAGSCLAKLNGGARQNLKQDSTPHLQTKAAMGEYQCEMWGAIW